VLPHDVRGWTTIMECLRPEQLSSKEEFFDTFLEEIRP
jgi:hypothetical protein